MASNIERKTSANTTYPNLPLVDPAAEVHKPASTEDVKVFITTWNMGNAEAIGLNNIFEEKDVSQFDILCVGLQESTYTMKDNSMDCYAQLEVQLKLAVGDEFYLIEHCYRAQLQLFLFAKNSLKDRIGNIEKYVENTGFLHVFPNKGGLLVTMNVDGTRLAFISCHLTAHEGVKHCEQRNASTVEILGGARAGDPRFDVTEQFHHVFWMGDMNYRLTFSSDTPSNTKKNIAELNAKAKQAVVTTDDVEVKVKDDAATKPAGCDDDDSSESEHEDEGEESHKSSKAAKKAEHRANRKKVLEMVKAEQWKELLDLDELNREIAAGRILNQFTALQPSFPPTFKRTRHQILPPSMTDVADPDEFYNEKRIPSFTDRILFKSLPAFAKSIEPLFFDSCERATSSDHKPVRAGFKIDLCKGKEDILIDRELLNKTSHVGHTRSLQLKVHDLKGFNLEDMDVGGGSDPYVLIITDPPSLLMHRNKLVMHNDGVKSSVITKDLNPVWKDTLSLNIASLDLEGLSRNASLIFSVWDEDTFNADDLIGSGSIPFRDLLDSLLVKKESYNFDLVLRSNAEIMGRLTGSISLDGKIEDYLEAAKGFVQERHQLANGESQSAQAHPRFIHLARAEQEVGNKQNGCCTIN